MNPLAEKALATLEDDLFSLQMLVNGMRLQVNELKAAIEDPHP